MRYPAPEKLEIIGLVEQSHLSVRRTLAQIGVPPATFYRWYDLYQTGGPEALEDRGPRPSRVWNASPMMSAAGSCNWPWTSQNCRHGSWPCALLTPRAISCQRLRW